MFLGTLIPKSIDKVKRFPELGKAEDIANCKDFFDFDNRVTAPWHGFRDAEHYYAVSSAKPLLKYIAEQVVDDLVEKALARWPNVPAIAGWLKLSLQGDWLLTGPVPEGLTISHPRILNFMARNYGCEADGRYYFQNGPQKAYVHLAYTPWGLHESNSELVHDASWAVPEVDPDTLIAARTKL
eukprot:gene11658-11453_t